MVRLVDGLRCLAVDVVETGSLQLLIRAAAPLEAWDRYQSEGVADFGFEYAGSERFHLTAFADEGKPRAALLRHLSKEP
jgi:Tfp pilus assembly pilus retraction ATPase PilT